MRPDLLEAEMAGGDRSTRTRRAAAVFRLLADPERSPVLAAIGMGDVVRTACEDTMRRIREDMAKRRADAADTFELAFGRLPRNLNELVDQLEPAELRKRADLCGRFGVELYEFLTARGEIAVSRVQESAETAYQNGKLDVGTVGMRFAVAAAEDIRALAQRIADKPDNADR